VYVHIPTSGKGGVNKHKLDMSKLVVNTNIADTLVYPIPPGCSQNKAALNIPSPGKFVVLHWIDKQGIQRMSVGECGPIIPRGSDSNIVSMNYLGSSEQGSCGGVYTDCIDGHIVGIHGIGAPEGSHGMYPSFYPFNEQFIEWTKNTASGVKPYDYSSVSERNYVESYEKEINTKKKPPTLNTTCLQKKTVRFGTEASEEKYPAKPLSSKDDNGFGSITPTPVKTESGPEAPPSVPSHSF